MRGGYLEKWGRSINISGKQEQIPQTLGGRRDAMAKRRDVPTIGADQAPVDSKPDARVYGARVYGHTTTVMHDMSSPPKLINMPQVVEGIYVGLRLRWTP